MIEFQKQILQNEQFKKLCKSNISSNSFLFDSTDSVFLENFVLSFAKFILCGNKQYNLPCENCLSCQKSNLLTHPDLVIYPQNKKEVVLVEDVKNLIENAYLKPFEGDKKVFVFKNFSSANIQAQNKLLKILEEPPKNVFILLCVNNISKVLPTIVSRCQKIKLNGLSDEELATYIKPDKLSNGDAQDKLKTIIDIAQGSVQKAVLYSSDKEFLNTFDSCMQVLNNLKNSSQLLSFSSKFQTKESFETALVIFESIYRDLLLFRLNKVDLIKNKNILNQIKNLAQEYDSDCIDKIIKKLYFIKEQLEFNCNYVLLVDSLLLYILEVKFLCKRK